MSTLIKIYVKYLRCNRSMKTCLTIFNSNPKSPTSGYMCKFYIYKSTQVINKGIKTKEDTDIFCLPSHIICIMYMPLVATKTVPKLNLNINMSNLAFSLKWKIGKIKVLDMSKTIVKLLPQWRNSKYISVPPNKRHNSNVKKTHK